MQSSLCNYLNEYATRRYYRGARRNDRGIPKWVTTSVNCFNTFSRCIYIEMKGVIKQDNAINFYYINFLGMVMLRPVLVTLGGGA
jgi:hypothetical protein